MTRAMAFASLALALATAARAQQPPIERLRAIAARDDRVALTNAVRERPDDSRELVRRLLVEAGTMRGATADSALVLSRRVARAYAAAWADSFPLAQVARFSEMSPDRRAAKIAADSVRRAGNDALGRAGVATALKLWREALRRATALGDTAAMAAALGNIGTGFYRASALDSAERYLERARELAESVGDRRTALNALGALGTVANERGDLRRAQVLYSRALELRARIGDVRGMAADHNNLGLLAASLGELGEARGHYEEALALARRHELNEPAAAALLNLANAASVEAEYAEAVRWYGEALATYRSLGDDDDIALVLRDLGLMELRRGNYVTARARLAEALAIYQRLAATADVVQVRSDLASVAAAAGDLRAAVSELRAAERLLARTVTDARLAAGIALARADLATQLNTYAAAEREYERAEALARKAGDGAGEAEAQQGRAMLLAEREEYAQALELLRTAARTQAASGDRRPAALTRLSIGQVQLRQGDSSRARHTFEQALDSLRAIGDAVGEAAALGALGDLELSSGKPLAAESAYRRGLARLKGRAAATIAWQLHAGLGSALRERGALADAATELRAAIADVERITVTLALAERRATFLADKWDVYAELAAVERARSDVAAAFAVSERMRSREMLDLLARGRVAIPVTADSSLVEREQDLRRQIGELTQRLEAEEGAATSLRGPDLESRSSGVTREALARAQERYEQLLLELREGGGYAPVVRGEAVSWRDVASKLAPDEAVVEYLVSDSTTVAFVVTRDTLRAVNVGVDRNALAALVDFARGTMRRPRGSSLPPAWRLPLRRLHERLIAPLEGAGALAGVRRLVVVPHAELHYLPFAALIRGADGGARDEFLVERYEITYAPSASVWLRLGERAPRRAEGVLALAPRVGALPGSREEVEGIRTLYGPQATVLMNAAASEPAFRAAAPRYGIVHLATYGLLNKHNPLFSFVELARGAAGSDGRLEVHEVFSLALDARLVVLSACQTALASGAVSDVPAGDDWVGLVRAFLGAGAAKVIATLWPVEDRSTARLMVALHGGLRGGRSELAALTEAQRQALRNPATADPFYWAGFVLVGGR